MKKLKPEDRKIYSKKDIKRLFEKLYFEYSLEDLKVLDYLTDKGVEDWVKNNGRKLSQIGFALAIEGDIKYVLRRLEEKELSK